MTPQVGERWRWSQCPNWCCGSQGIVTNLTVENGMPYVEVDGDDGFAPHEAFHAERMEVAVPNLGTDPTATGRKIAVALVGIAGCFVGATVAARVNWRLAGIGAVTGFWAAGVAAQKHLPD